MEDHLEMRVGLELAPAIDDEGKAGVADSQIFDQGVECLEIDRGLDHEARVAFRSTGGDDEVRRPAQSGKDIADDALVFQNVLKPVGLRIVGHLQIEWSRIGDLDAFRIHQSEIHEGAVVLFAQDVEHLAEELGITEALDGMLTGDDPGV